MKHNTHINPRLALIPGLLVWLLGGAISASAQTCVTLPEGCVAWWGANGNANDTRGTNNGVLVGNEIFAQGMVGTAFNVTTNIGYANCFGSGTSLRGGGK